MAIKNSSFTLSASNFLILIISLFVVSCSSLRSRPPVETPVATEITEKPPVVPEALRPTETVIARPAPEVARDEPLPPQIGLILGPGSVRAFAHVGVVQELVKAKLPITQVVGVEIGALVGAVYAAKGLPFDVEWQRFKLKDFKSTQSFLQLVFQNQKTEDFKIPFACPAFNLTKQQNFMMNKGLVTQMLPYCLSIPPLIMPHSHNVAGSTELKAAVDYLKSKGVNYIVYVNVLNAKDGILTGDLEGAANIYWSLVAQNLSKQWPAVDFVLSVPVQEFDLVDFGKRREIMQRGLEAGQATAAQIARRLGL